MSAPAWPDMGHPKNDRRLAGRIIASDASSREAVGSRAAQISDQEPVIGKRVGRTNRQMNQWLAALATF